MDRYSSTRLYSQRESSAGLNSRAPRASTSIVRIANINAKAAAQLTLAPRTDLASELNTNYTAIVTMITYFLPHLIKLAVRLSLNYYYGLFDD